MHNQSLLEDQEGMLTSGLIHNNSSCSSWTSLPQFSFQHLMKTLNNNNNNNPSLGEDVGCHLSGNQLGSTTSSMQRASAILWPWGEMGEGVGIKRSQAGDHQNNSSLAIAAMKMKKVKSRRKVREPRFCFKTLSDVDVLDDGYKWRKYGQKVVKNTQHPRSYYRCTQDNCRVKKRVERLAEDPRMVITTYEGRHIHSPWHDVDDTNASSQLDFIW